MLLTMSRTPVKWPKLLLRQSHTVEAEVLAEIVIFL